MVTVSGKGSGRVSVAGLVCLRPGARSHLLYRVRIHRGRRGERRLGRGARDHRGRQPPELLTGQAAGRLGADANYMWTAFGSTNVAIHRVNTAMEFGDVQIALDIGPALDTSGLPTERRVRHALDVARAYSARNRRDEGLAVVLDAERMAPEQVRHHYISRQLVLTWMRQQRRPPSLELAGLAARLRLT